MMAAVRSREHADNACAGNLALRKLVYGYALLHSMMVAVRLRWRQSGFWQFGSNFAF